MAMSGAKIVIILLIESFKAALLQFHHTYLDRLQQLLLMSTCQVHSLALHTVILLLSSEEENWESRGVP